MDTSPKLLWCPVMHKEKPAGQILVSAELILFNKVPVSNFYVNGHVLIVNLCCSNVSFFCDFLQEGETELPLAPPKRGDVLYMVPQGVRPVVQLTMIEVF